MRILTPKDSGRIQLRERGRRGAVLAIRADGEDSSQRQWFHFVVRDAQGVPLELTIANAGRCTYPSAWEDYRVCASYDGEDWFRVDTTYDGERLTIRHAPQRDGVAYAYFAPYPTARRRALHAQALAGGRAISARVGQSVRGEPIQVLRFGKGEKKLWMIGHQHPGETMGAWFMEGAALRLMDDEDVLVNDLLERASVYLVSSMNPDGHYLGNHRTNALGIDLNRAWHDPSAQTSPEVFAVREAMLAAGVDFFVDVHGDEQLPWVFTAGAEGNPHYSERIAALEHEFDEAMCDLSVPYQTENGYPKDAPGDGDLRCAANWVGEEFDCLALTLEMPFKDAANEPDEENGWTPGRSKAVAGAVIEAVHSMVDELR
jgi:murein tripeptide amidase MpaA